MSTTSSTSSRPGDPGDAVTPRLKLLPVLLLTLELLLGLLAVAAAWAISREYSDPDATALHIGTQAMGDWWGAVVGVAALGLAVVVSSRGSRGRRVLVVAAALAALSTAVAVPAGALVGATQKQAARHGTAP